MLVVHDVVAGLEVVVVVLATTRAARASVHAPASGEVGFGHEREARAGEHDSPLDRCDHEADRTRRGRARTGVEALAGEDVAQPLRRPGAVGGEHDLVALARERAQPARQRVGVADDRIEGAGGDARRVGTVGGREHRHRAGAGVREQAVELERETREIALARSPPR